MNAIEYSVRENPTSPTKSVVITLPSHVSLVDHLAIPKDAPNKLVATVCNEIDNGIRPLYSEKVAASFDEKKIEYEDDDRLCRNNAENFRVKT